MLCCVTIAVHGLLLFQGVPDPLAERVLREAPVAWAAYEAWAWRAGVQGTWHSKYTAAGPPKRVFTNYKTKVRFDGTGKCGLALTQNTPDSGTKDSDGKLEAANGIYAFRLTRPRADAPWVLEWVERLTSPEERPKGFLVNPRIWCRSFHKAPYSIFLGGVSLLHAMKDLDWRVVRAEELPGTQLIKLEFTTVPKNAREGWWELLKSGFVTLEPRRHYAIHGFDLNLELENGRKKRLYGSYTYKDVADQWIVPQRLDFTTESEGNVIYWQIEFDLTANGHADEREFRLSYYGFPEPFGVEWERPTPWWLYLGGGTLGLMAVLILISWIRRWRSARQAAA